MAPTLNPIRYLALGDSYTIGTALPEADNFPTALAARVEQASRRAVTVTNLGVNGYTSADLVRDQLAHARPGRYDLVTLLIGVNDFVQGVPLERYRANLEVIHGALGGLGLPKGRVVVVSVPDFSFTPAAGDFGSPAEIADGIRGLNTIGAELAAARALPFVDIFGLSREGVDRPGWIAPDGLHPGPSQYLAWVERIWTRVLAATAAQLRR